MCIILGPFLVSLFIRIQDFWGAQGYSGHFPLKILRGLSPQVPTPMLPILSVAVMSQIGILTPDCIIAAVPCYSPQWKIAFGVNDEVNKIRVCIKITSRNNFLFENVINNDNTTTVSRENFTLLDQKQLK